MENDFSKDVAIDELFVPPLAELRDHLRSKMKENFKNIEIEVVDSPDFTSSPWYLADSGFGGESIILDVGGPNNVNYVENHSISFNLEETKNKTHTKGSFIFGCAAAEPKNVEGNVLAELMINTDLDKKLIKSKYSKVIEPRKSYKTENYPSNSFGLLANLYVSEGKPGKVIYIKASVRTGTSDFVSSIRNSIINSYPDKAIGMGGVFRINSGKIKAHVMPDFSSCDLLDQVSSDNWLNFFEMESPMTCVSLLVTQDPNKERGKLKDGRELRLQHTHFWSDKKEGGHYHYDVTPLEIEYEGYYIPAPKIARLYPPTCDPKRTKFFVK